MKTNTLVQDRTADTLRGISDILFLLREQFFRYDRNDEDMQLSLAVCHGIGALVDFALEAIEYEIERDKKRGGLL